jgi:hypothetical protein
MPVVSEAHMAPCDDNVESGPVTNERHVAVEAHVYRGCGTFSRQIGPVGNV